MENLNNEQIETVVTWMETWEQLKNTAIPIRFKEDFEKQLHQSAVMCRTCKTCGHRHWDRCNLGGFFVTTERRYPTLCGKDFDKWMPEPPKLGLKRRLLSFWYGT